VIELENASNQISIILDDFEIYLDYLLRTPERIYLPQKLQRHEKESIAEFPMGKIIDRIEQIPKGLKVIRKWNLEYNGELQLLFQISCRLQPVFFLLPGIIVNGNRFGKGNYPKPKLTETHSFREDRCSIPSCGIIENSERGIGLFTEPAKSEADISSISISQRENVVYLKVLVPWEEQPVRYVSKYRRIKGKTNYLTLNGQFSYERNFYIIHSHSEGKMKAYYEVLRQAWAILAKSPSIPNDWTDWIRKKVQLAVNVFYAKVGNAHGFITAVANPFLPVSPTFSAGFLGKNIEIAYCLYRMYLKKRFPRLREIAVNVINFMTSKTLPNGLFYTDYCPAFRQWYGYRLGRTKNVSTRMMGEVCYNLLKMYQAAKQVNDANEKWIEIVQRFCDFMVENQPPTGNFGKWWSPKGVLVDDSGTNGAYVIWALTELYKITQNEKYKQAAIKAANYYIQKFVLTDEYWGDTLDANAIDKEAGHAILRAMILLFEITQDRRFLQAACRAGHFVATWQIVYNIPFPENSALGQRRFKTFGVTIVSVENMHSDPYICFALDYLWLWKYTQDLYWKERALAALQWALQMVANEHDTLGYKKWFVGWQPEQYNHTIWQYYGSSMLFPERINPKGKYANNIAWVLAATMGTVFDISEYFPELIQVNPTEIQVYKKMSYKISKLFRDLILRILPL